MARQMFIRSDGEYKNGLFPKIPNYLQDNAWYILTDGTRGDILINDRTTVNDIRNGHYRRLVLVSKTPEIVDHAFNTACKEMSYTLKIRIEAKVSVVDPIIYFHNIDRINIQTFLNTRFFVDVRRITKKYSILEYSEMEDELVEVLTMPTIEDDQSGLSYSISKVAVEPNEQAREVLKNIDDMHIRNKTYEVAGNMGEANKHKTYDDAVRESAALGKISHEDAIIKIEEYRRGHFERSLAELKQMLDDDVISQEQYREISQTMLLPPSPRMARRLRIEAEAKNNRKATYDADIDNLYNDQE